jgi:hypothetical protein
MRPQKTGFFNSERCTWREDHNCDVCLKFRHNRLGWKELQHGHVLAKLLDVCAVGFSPGRILRTLGPFAMSFFVASDENSRYVPHPHTRLTCFTSHLRGPSFTSSHWSCQIGFAGLRGYGFELCSSACSSFLQHRGPLRHLNRPVLRHNGTDSAFLFQKPIPTRTH